MCESYFAESVPAGRNKTRKQERPLGQRKTPPANKLPDVTFRLIKILLATKLVYEM